MTKNGIQVFMVAVYPNGKSAAFFCKELSGNILPLLLCFIIFLYFEEENTAESSHPTLVGIFM